MDLARQALLLESRQVASGAGVTVAVLDSGVCPEHPDLEEAVQVAESCHSLDATTADLSGHGTHVIGIIAGAGKVSDCLYRGIAPSATVVSIKVAGHHLKGLTDDLVQGILRQLNWA